MSATLKHQVLLLEYSKCIGAWKTEEGLRYGEGYGGGGVHSQDGHPEVAVIEIN